ncbi:MAG: helix-turn-helix transcriptional regulator [Bacteroidia bacterium]|nr:helix-turn-helix transcriptional regulator [Bacteroidia bacterium]
MQQSNWFAQQFAKFEKDPEFHAGVLRLSFYEDVLRIMEEKGINRSELAARLGCSKAYITKLFSDSTNVTIQTMAKISFALDCELSITMNSKEKKSGCTTNAQSGRSTERSNRARKGRRQYLDVRAW